MTLAERMDAITDDAFGIGRDEIKMKSKAGVEFKIKGHTFDAVMSEMRPLLQKHGVSLKPNLAERTYSGNRCDVMIDFVFSARDNPQETETVRWAGSGCDDGDKGFSKAGTNALKEMLKKRFLITDRDDAKEEEDKVEHKTDEGMSRASVDKAAEKVRAKTEAWMKTFRSAVKTAKDSAAVDRLYRDSRDELAELPQVTRDFFADLRTKRKAELGPAAPDPADDDKDAHKAADLRLAAEGDDE